MKPILLNATDARYPARLVAGTMPQLSAFGNLNLLALPKTALFCSARCPGHAILSAYDQAARWRDAGRCIISGFHSPVEKECLRILLRGSQPIIICAARSLAKTSGRWPAFDSVLLQRERASHHQHPCRPPERICRCARR